MAAATIPAGFRALPLSVTQLSLAAVLQCGQSFRWNILPLVSAGSALASDVLAPTHEYRLCLRDRVVCLRQSPDVLFYRSVFPGLPPSPVIVESRDAETLAWIRDYFQLNVDLVQLHERWSKRDPVLKNYKDRFGGIRILRQDPFENLISFICSSNNNISRITKMVKNLCQHYSPPLLTLPPPTTSSDEPASQAETVAESYHPFPSPSALASPEVSARLRSLSFGYRADFIQKTAKMLVETHGSMKSDDSPLEPSEKWLLTLRQMDTCNAREELLKFMGVGYKVADCILLMSLDKNEVIPVDTHVHQIAVKHYGFRTSAAKGKANMTPKLYEEVSTKLAAVWGDYAGWAHSVLFTSDLKSFSSYGLSSPSPSPAVDNSSRDTAGIASLPTTPSPSPSKRKRATAVHMSREKTAIVTDEKPVGPQSSMNASEPDDQSLSMADRVKRRRRVKEVTVVSTRS